MHPEIRLATSESDRHAIYRFRYQVYIEELGVPQLHADHDRRIVKEPMDLDGNLVTAWCGGRIVGTVRFNFASPTTLAEYEQLYQLRRFAPFYPNRITVSTKLMMARGYRDGLLSLRLYAAAFEQGIQRGVCFNFMSSDSSRLPYYRRLGYREVIPEIVHPEYGRVQPMVYVLHDAEYLRQIRSPLASFAPECADDFGSVEFFNQNFSPAALAAV